jgi:hypothetical protein
MYLLTTLLLQVEVVGVILEVLLTEQHLEAGAEELVD